MRRIAQEISDIDAMEVVRVWKTSEKTPKEASAEANTSRFQRWAERYIDDTNQEFMYDQAPQPTPFGQD